MKIEKFEDIVAWQKSGELSLVIYKVFKDNNDFAFKNQIQRAVVSIMNNIAEGFERKSNKGSCGEVRSMLYLSFKLNYLSESEFKKLYNLSVEISKTLSGFIKTL